MASPTAVQRLEAHIDTLEQAGRYDEAIAALGELEGLTGDDQRWHVAWMHVRAGRRREADAIWATLADERPGDPTVPFLAGSAHAEALEPETAASRFADALELALRGGADGATLRQIVTARTDALATAQLEPGPVDERARRALARAAAQGVDTPVATPFFAREEFGKAVTTLPLFGADWAPDGHAAYAHELDQRLRAVAAQAPRHPVIVPLTVDEVIAHAAAHNMPADAAEARARAAYELAQTDRAILWPPRRNDPCWCGSTTKYKKCCGR